MAQKNPTQIEATEHVPPSEQGGGFPPFQKDTFPSQILWLALFFIALYLLMSRIGLPRVRGILESRQQRIAGDISAAERLEQPSDHALAGYEKAPARAPNPRPGPAHGN